MKRYIKAYDTFICFDTDNKTIVSATNNGTVDSKTIAYTNDPLGFDRLYENAVQKVNGNGTPGPNTTGWAETTEEVFNLVKNQVQSFLMTL